MNQQIELLEQQSKGHFIELTKAKQYLRVEHDYDDEMIQDMLTIVLVAAENYIGLCLLPSSWCMTIYNHLPSVIKLLPGPIVKLEQFKLYRHNNEISYLSEKDYFLNKFAENIRLSNHYPIQKAEIIYHTGYLNLPLPIKQGMLEHLAKLYDLRGGDQALPIAAKSLYQAYKRV